MNKKNFFIFFLILFLSGCGFKAYNKLDLIKFNITEIETSGDKRVNYKLKNSILENLKKDNNNNNYKLSITSSKNRSIKEKNINNQVTKYEINIIVKVQLFNNINENILKFQLSEKNVFNATKQHSKLINEEKRVVEQITEIISEKIIDALIEKTNDI